MERWINKDGEVYYDNGDGRPRKQEDPGMTPAMFAAALSGDIGNVLAATMPGGIERQEAEGQRDFVESKNQLPLKVYPEKDRHVFTEMGIKFGKAVDDLFCEAEFPEGWKIRATDHSMWNELIDDKDQVMGQIFYKAAFYDREAFLRVA